MTLPDEWRYLANEYQCWVSQEGDVKQDGVILEPHLFGDRGFRWVTLTRVTAEYDYENGGRIKKTEPYPVWHLVQEAYFHKFPIDSDLVFVDGDPWNCSVENIRAWNGVQNRLIRVREEYGKYVFDKRLRGEVEIVELDMRFESATDAAKYIGGTRSGVARALSGDIPKHRGLTFRWV